MQEIYKDIPWYEWLYQVSNYWNVKSLWRKMWFIKSNDKLLKQQINFWYCLVALIKDWKRKDSRVHRLVASAFLWFDLANSKMLVCHKNDIRDDNRVENLFIWTHLDNNIDCINKWRSVDNRWEKHWQHKLTDTIIWEISKMIKDWIYQYEIAKIYWVNQSVISRIKNWKAWGFINL